MSHGNQYYRWGSNLFWSRTAWIAGIFALSICILLIFNYLQFKKTDPVNMTVMNTLVERLYENPDDATLRDQIRSLDLLWRKAYFTSQWQIRVGGMFLLAAVALVIISLQVIEYRRKINPVIIPGQVDEMMVQNQKARKWIIAGGGAILMVAVVFAFLASRDLTQKFGSPLTQGSTEMVVAADTASNVIMPEQETDSVAGAVEVPETAKVDSAAIIKVSTDNFPNFRGNGGAGIVSKSNVPSNWDGTSGKNIKWKTAIPLPGFSSPVVWGDKIFLTGGNSSKQEVYCVDSNSGKILWTIPVGKPETKKPKVSPETGHSAPTPVTDGKAVYAIFSTGDIAAIDFEGKKLWEKDLGLPKNHYGHSSSLLIYKESVIVQYDQTGSPKVMALSVKDGKTIWSTDRPVKVSWASPILVNTGKRNELILVAEPYVASYNPANGKELWKIECIGGEVGPSLGYANGIAFTVNEYSKLCAVKVGDEPSILWENADLLSDIPSPVANDKYLFMVTSYGILVCFDAVSGEKYWEHDFGNPVYSSPMLVNGKLYLLDRQGTMHIIASDKEYKSLGEAKLGEKSACTPAFTNGRIYIRGDKNLYCIGA